MPGFDDRLTRELERAARPAAPDVVRTFSDVTRRRAYRAVVRRVQAVAVVVAILAGTAGAFLLLDDRFEENQPVSAVDPTTLQWRPVLAVGDVGELTCDPSSCTSELLSADTIVLAGRDELVGDADVAYALGEVFADGTDVATAELLPYPTQPDVPYSVVLTLDEDASERYSRASARADQAEPPDEQLAVVWDGEVLSGPTATQPVPATSLQLSFATEAEARALIEALNVPTPPPEPSVDPSYLQERPVLDIWVADDPNAPSPTCTASACRPDDLASTVSVTLVDSSGQTILRLGPVVFDASNITGAQAVEVGGAEWVVTYELDDEGTAAFAKATRDAVGGEPPRNQIAIVLDGAVVSAPVVQEPITSGSGQISSGFTEDEARALAAALVGSRLAPTTPSPDAVGRDLGLEFRVCRVRDLAGIDLGDGPIATAFVGGRVMDDRCPDEYEGPNILAIDLTSDSAADTWIELPRCLWCEPVGSIGSTLFVLLQGGSTPEYGIYRLDETLDVVPLTMDAPGDPEWGFPAGEPVTFWTGGDEGYSYWVACTGDAQWPTFVVTQSAVPVDTPVGSPYVRHATEFTWDVDGAFVLATSDEDLVLGDPGRPDPPSGGCAIDFGPYA